MYRWAAMTEGQSSINYPQSAPDNICELFCGLGHFALSSSIVLFSEVSLFGRVLVRVVPLLVHVYSAALLPALTLASKHQPQLMQAQFLHSHGSILNQLLGTHACNP